MPNHDKAGSVDIDNKPTYEGSLLFGSLPREICWGIVILLSKNDLFHLICTSKSMRAIIEKASNYSKFSVWTIRDEESRESYVEACMRRYLARYASSMEQACRVLSSALSSTQPMIRVGLFGSTKLIRSEPSGLFKKFINNALSLPENFYYNGYKINVGNIYGVENELTRSGSFDFSIADVFVCIAANTAEFDTFSNLFSTKSIMSLGDKILIIAHPSGVKIDTKNKLTVHAFFELSGHHLDKNNLAAYCLDTLRKFADMKQAKETPPLMRRLAH